MLYMGVDLGTSSLRRVGSVEEIATGIVKVKMVQYPLTDVGIAKFQADCRAVFRGQD